MKIPIEDITTENRIRKEMGDLISLKSSLSQVGQLVPLGVIATTDAKTHKYRLIHGMRRLTAATELGWTEIDVQVLTTITDLQQLLAQRDENVERMALTPSECVAFARLIEPLEKAAAKERQHHNTAVGGTSVKLTEASKGEAKAKTAKAVGKSRNTLTKAQKVVAAAEAAPEKYGHLQDEMDKTGKVSGVHKKLLAQQKVSSTSSTVNNTAPKDPWMLRIKALNFTASDLAKIHHAPLPEPTGSQAMAITDSMTIVLLDTTFVLSPLLKSLDVVAPEKAKVLRKSCRTLSEIFHAAASGTLDEKEPLK